ncbi:MAG: nuclease-related domain-containing protein [Pedococcus sp.]
MVPEIVRLERAGVCGCGELVAAGERAGYAAQHARVVCLACLARMSVDSGPDEAPSGASALVPATWTADAHAIAATLDALRLQPLPTWSPCEPAVLHVPTEWSAPLSDPTALACARSTEMPLTLPRRKPRAGALPEVDATGTTDLTAAAITPRPTPSAPPPPTPTATLVSEPTPPEARVATPSETRVPTESGADTPGSRHEAAAVEDLSMPAAAPRRRAGLFGRLLTVRSFRTQQAAPRVTKQHAAVCALLDAAEARGVVSLHNRRVPGRRGRMEHIAVGAGGIYVVDVLHFKNASIEVRHADGPDAGTDDLVVGGRVLTPAARAVAQRVEVLRMILLSAGLADVPVTGALCFVDGLLPLSVSDLQVEGMHVLRPSGLTALVAASGSISQRDCETLREFLAERLPAST